MATFQIHLKLVMHLVSRLNEPIRS